MPRLVQAEPRPSLRQCPSHPVVVVRVARGDRRATTRRATRSVKVQAQLDLTSGTKVDEDVSLGHPIWLDVSPDLQITLCDLLILAEGLVVVKPDVDLLGLGRRGELECLVPTAIVSTRETGMQKECTIQVLPSWKYASSYTPCLPPSESHRASNPATPDPSHQ